MTGFRRIREADDVRDKSVSTTRRGSEVSVLAPRFAEDATYDRDYLGEIVLLHHDARPQIGQEPVLCQQLTRALDEVKDRVEDLRRDGQGLRPALGKEQPPACVQPEIAELVSQVRLEVAHGGPSELPRNFQADTKDF